MSKAKHTPGKWEISSRSEYTVVQSGLNRSIATTGGYSDNQRSESVEIENKANARLIAASPELKSSLESLSDMVIRKCNIGNDPTLIDLLNEVQKAKELIKKIEG